jgi:signal peptide peptidase SppA
LAIASVAGPIEKAFAMSKLPSVAIVVNSPGGSPVQSHLIFNRIRQLAREKEKRVYVFCEDIAASGGYFLALAGDEIYADPSSIVGSIGVISAGFGLDKFIERFGVQRRVHATGKDKGALDPFQPERPEDVARLKDLQREVHEVFTGVVRERRGARLKGPEEELFSGAFWSAQKAMQFGLIDGLADLRSKMRSLHGEDVRLKVVPLSQGGLLSRFRRLQMFPTGASDGFALPTSFADDLVSAVETRALWSRFGL